MSKHDLTRRGFIGVTASVAGAAACAGGVSSLTQAFANPPKPLVEEQIHTLCDGCGNKCPMIAWKRNGELWRYSGEVGHPLTRGHLCGRGQGLASQVMSEDRLTTPLKNNGNGKFEEVSWDEALADIAGKVGGLGEKLAILQARGNCEFYTKRLAAALGTPNYFNDSALHDIDFNAAINVSGGAYPSPDVENAKFILMLGKSSYDGMRPAEEAEFANTDAEVVLVDARMGSFGRVADEWIPIIPGSELALLMAIAHELIRSNKYDKDFVAKHAAGFSKFSKALSGCTLTWASEKTGIGEGVIGGLAAKLANNAPAAFVDYSWGGSFGAAYKNSFDTCRMVYLLNAMLGNFNAKGGWIFGKAPWVSDEMLAKQGIPLVAAAEAQPVGADVALYGGTSCVSAIQAMQSGDITAAILVETNPVVDYPAAGLAKDSLDRLQFLVVMDEFMTDTAQMADYVLPLASYLECGSTVQATGAVTSAVSLRKPVIDRLSEQTKSIDEAVCALAAACGKGDLFDFSLKDYNRAWCKAAGIDYSGLASAGTATVVGSQVKYGSTPYFTTASGKVEFAPAGVGAPKWVDPANIPSKENPRLLVGQQAIHTASFTTASSQLMEISKMYELDAVWINEQVAEELGIHNGGRVKVSTNEGSITAPAKVTKLICPEAIWMPVHYGATSAEVSEAKGFGESALKLISLAAEPKTGAAMTFETLATIERAGE